LRGGEPENSRPFAQPPLTAADPKHTRLRNQLCEAYPMTPNEVPMRLDIAEEQCWGCKACEVACNQENPTPAGVKRIHIRVEGLRIRDGRWNYLFRANRCRHCGDPPCADACSAGAIQKRDDGIVVLDAARCVGCRSCVDACPFHAIAFDEASRIAAKCNLCHHRVDQGLVPACADDVCPLHCIRLLPDAEGPFAADRA
jgi:Fe-S-cluster-containing dehydrogenase component